MALLAALAPFVPLAQTLLWVLLILFLVVWLRKPLRDLISVVLQRIASGSSVKAGPFELSELIPQTPDQQRARAKEGLRNAMRSAA